MDIAFKRTESFTLPSIYTGWHRVSKFLLKVGIGSLAKILILLKIKFFSSNFKWLLLGEPPPEMLKPEVLILR